MLNAQITKLEREYVNAVRAYGADTQIAGMIHDRLMRLYKERLAVLCTL